MLDNKWIRHGILMILVSPLFGWACYAVGIPPLVAALTGFAWFLVGVALIYMADE